MSRSITDKDIVGDIWCSNEFADQPEGALINPSDWKKILAIAKRARSIFASDPLCSDVSYLMDRKPWDINPVWCHRTDGPDLEDRWVRNSKKKCEQYMWDKVCITVTQLLETKDLLVFLKFTNNWTGDMLEIVNLPYIE